MNQLLPQQLIYDMAGGVQVALGAGQYKEVFDKRTGRKKLAVVPMPGKKLDSVSLDLIPIYDTIALNVTGTFGPPETLTIQRPTQRFEFFTGAPTLTWADTGVNQTVQKNKNWNNFSGTNGNAVGNNDAYAAIGIYFEIHPYISFQFENWLLKLLNPILSIEVGQRAVERYTSKLCHFKNYNPLKGLDSTTVNVIAPAVAATAPVRGVVERDDLPTQMWNTPLILGPQDTIKINIDFTNSLAPYLANYLLSANEMLAYQGAAAATATPLANKFLNISLGFFGGRGSRLA